EDDARLEALLAVMSTLDDTCLLHRGGPRALQVAQRGAAAALRAGGPGTAAGRAALLALDAELLALNVSPGGSADLLAAVLFLDGVGAELAPPRR
uniref:triphosphoribosyl-dephospho-CoA synthase n=3 Tax=unclassified Anaeromyxobacter TaxID=2620896 RepID=UPI001F566777